MTLFKIFCCSTINKLKELEAQMTNTGLVLNGGEERWSSIEQRRSHSVNSKRAVARSLTVAERRKSQSAPSFVRLLIELEAQRRTG